MRHPTEKISQTQNSGLDSSAVPAKLQAVVAQSNLFAGINEQARDSVAGAAERCEVVNDLIIRGGERATGLYLLASGRVKYYRVSKTGQELLLWWLLPGDIFGLATLLKHPLPYLGNAQALARCELLMWKHAAIREFASIYPQLAENALRITFHYLSAYANRHEGIITQSAEQRLAQSLIHLGHRSGHPHHDHVEVQITNEQLGQLADVGLFTATRFLSAWEKKGAIRKTRGKILIQSPENLPID